MRGPASTRITRAELGSMRRNSRARVWRAISAKAPAISTPVGPPPTTTKVRQARRAWASGSRSAALEGEKDAVADVEGILEGLEAGRERRPLVVAEVGVGGPRGEHEEVVAELAVGQHAAAGPRGRPPPPRPAGRGRSPGARRMRRMGEAISAGRQARGRDLVEQRLEEVMIAAVQENHRHGLPAQAPRGAEAREATPHDHHLRRRHGEPF